LLAGRQAEAMHCHWQITTDTRRMPSRWPTSCVVRYDYSCQQAHGVKRYARLQAAPRGAMADGSDPGSGWTQLVDTRSHLLLVPLDGTSRQLTTTRDPSVSDRVHSSLAQEVYSLTAASSCCPSEMRSCSSSQSNATSSCSSSRAFSSLRPCSSVSAASSKQPPP
jgi:hypothetical protein